MQKILVAMTILATVSVQMGSAADLYVATNGLGGGSSWADATNNLQGAIDVISGAYTTNTVWVSNGVYEAGGLTNYPTLSLLTNRVTIWKAITVRSANNDPTNTIIKGKWNATTTNGADAVRCVYMTNGASLIGFMLTNGATATTGNPLDGGGVECQSTNTVISNCVIVGNAAYYAGGGVNGGTLYNCTISNNSAVSYAGGVYNATLRKCTISHNISQYRGGGAHYGRLYDCTLSNNSAPRAGAIELATILDHCTIVNNTSFGPGSLGGGTVSCIASNCTYSGNSALWSSSSGGGTYNDTAYNCVFSNNSAYWGGGTAAGTFYNCLLVGNAGRGGGGARYGTFYNCTIVNNTALTSPAQGGGVSQSILHNSIVYFNRATTDSNWYNVTSCTNSCTAPLIAGDGNITANPLFVDTNTANYRLAADSPSVNTGLNQAWMTNTAPFDLDGRIRIRYGIVDMGAYECIYNGTIFRGR